MFDLSHVLPEHFRKKNDGFNELCYMSDVRKMLYNRTSMARTPLERLKYVRDRGSSS